MSGELPEEHIDIDYEMDRTEYEIDLMEEKKARYPQLVFKYKSVSGSVDFCRLLNIIRDNKIYLPNVEELNDPLEGFQCKMLESADERKKKRNQYRVLALSEDGFLAPLWSHYADGYAGICLCYRTDKSFSELVPVKYIDKTKSWSTDPDIAAREDLEMKSCDWSYEKEWRLIREDADSTDMFLKYDVDELACVLIGYKMDPAICREIRRNIPSDIKILTVYPNDDRFCLYAKDDAGREAYDTQGILILLDKKDKQ